MYITARAKAVYLATNTNGIIITRKSSEFPIISLLRTAVTASRKHYVSRGINNFDILILSGILTNTIWGIQR